ncbi:MAG: tRNA uridine-5-carboxymethylaminomethyl(34) synthesis enzyme MnmG, partial [Clostridiales bacterium]|nr:tRNA uridine-5-carboxymethylaminomethyl(34) synthesis enzyme MnmG [Clostridiales bacterium]
PAPFDPARPPLNRLVREQVEIQLKYQGYIDRQMRQVAEARRMEAHALPPDLDYDSLKGLRLEAREKLKKVRPMNLGQAGRISGVSPADIAVLMVFLEK